MISNGNMQFCKANLYSELQNQKKTIKIQIKKIKTAKNLRILKCNQKQQQQQ